MNNIHWVCTGNNARSIAGQIITSKKIEERGLILPVSSSGLFTNLSFRIVSKDIKLNEILKLKPIIDNLIPLFFLGIENNVFNEEDQKIIKNFLSRYEKNFSFSEDFLNTTLISIGLFIKYEREFITSALNEAGYSFSAGLDRVQFIPKNEFTHIFVPDYEIKTKVINIYSNNQKSPIIELISDFVGEGSFEFKGQFGLGIIKYKEMVKKLEEYIDKMLDIILN